MNRNPSTYQPQKQRIQAGFTLLEVMLAVIIIAIASAGLMKSVSYVKAELNSIKLRERAFQELTNYTNYWKARIAGYPSSLPPQVGGVGDEVILFTDDEGFEIKALCFRRTKEESIGQTMAEYHQLRTWIKWEDHSFGEKDIKRLEFVTYQLVFP